MVFLLVVIEVLTGIVFEAKMLPVERKDYRLLTKKRYWFHWKSFIDMPAIQVHKLVLVKEQDIVGLVAFIDFPGESRLEIKLLASSMENVGKGKRFDGITDELFVFVCRLALRKYLDLACISLVPKTKLKQHYIKKYGMIDGGWQLYLEGLSLQTFLLKHTK